MHYADQYECCLRIIDGILIEQPDWNEARGCKVDTLVHLERWNDAWALAEEILKVEPGNTKAWAAKADVLEELQQWQDLLDLCADWENLSGASDVRREIAGYLAIASCGLERWEDMERWLDLWTGNPRHRMGLRRAVFRRAQKTFREPSQVAIGTSCGVDRP